jgi:hypothetical protein
MLGSSVTERLMVAGNADWQERRVPRCWPSVSGWTSGLQCGAGKPPPLYCHVLHARSRSGPHRPVPLNASSGQPKGRASYAMMGVGIWLDQATAAMLRMVRLCSATKREP